MNHECIEKFETKKYDHCSGEGYNKCSGTDPMMLEIWYLDTDGQEFLCDGWTETKVNFCPFCGVKAL